MAEAKPYAISKQVVWEAYQKVKANHGAAGVDGQSIEAFETDLKNNLYKIWNRHVLGELLPAAGAARRDPESQRGLRGRWGFPRSLIGWRRWSSRCIWSRWSSRVSMPTRTGIVPASRPWTRWRRPGSGAGVPTG